ncbi:hypothetical protein X975_19174, partial [Stegodyphus mimosarum]
MPSSRTHQSLSSFSSHSISDRSRAKSYFSRRSTVTNVPSQRPNRKMRCIIAIGIALPIIAAIIGIVAWAVSADSAFHDPVINSMRRVDTLTNPHEEDIFQVLENRNDLEYVQHRSSPSQELDQRDLSRVDDLQHIQHQDNFGNQDMRQQNSFDDASQKDPLYIVHFVPSPKPKVDSSTSSPDQVSTVSNDVLQKILSASKGAKPGTPQFVVFAPVPGED